MPVRQFLPLSAVDEAQRALKSLFARGEMLPGGAVMHDARFSGRVGCRQSFAEVCNSLQMCCAETATDGRRMWRVVEIARCSFRVVWHPSHEDVCRTCCVAPQWERFGLLGRRDRPVDSSFVQPVSQHVFRSRTEVPVARFGLAIAGLLAFSVAALGVTIWVMVDFLREQVIVAQLVKQLPPEAAESAVELAGELRWQFRLSILVVLNLLATGFALALLWRAYRVSEESLRDLRALAGDILSSVEQAVITTDRQGRISSINRRGLEMFESDADVVGQSLEELAPKLPLQEFRRDALEQGTARLTRDFRYQPPQPHHGTRTLRAFCDVLRDADEHEVGTIIQLRDVTERALIDERMQRMERFLELGSLAVGLHHEIKNPLAALSLHVQLLEEELEERDTLPEAAETMAIVRQEVGRIGNVLESFRDFASLGKLQFEEADLVELVARQVRLVSPQAQQSGIEVMFHRPKRSIPRFTLDAVKIEQVLLNLLTNAIEAMPEGGRLDVTLEGIGEESVESVIVEVRDTGIGIPEDLLGRVFDPYFTTKGDGTGMGLAICEKIVRQHEGTLEASTSSGGTVFLLTLPVERTPATLDQDDD